MHTGMLLILIRIVHAYNHFIENISSKYNSCFPVKSVVIKNKFKHKPWFTIIFTQTL